LLSVFLSCFLYFRGRDRLRAARLEFLNPAGGINELYFARVRRMAFGADFNPDFWFCRVYRESISAGTNNLRVMEIGWVDAFFHNEMIVCLFLPKVKDSAFLFEREGFFLLPFK
jgi:hypothetical protein